MLENEIYEFLEILLHSMFQDQDFKVSRDLVATEVVGWDSFRQVEIILELEERFGVQIKTRELDDLENLGSLVQIVVQKSFARESK